MIYSRAEILAVYSQLHPYLCPLRKTAFVLLGAKRTKQQGRAWNSRDVLYLETRLKLALALLR